MPQLFCETPKNAKNFKAGLRIERMLPASTKGFLPVFLKTDVGTD